MDQTLVFLIVSKTKKSTINKKIMIIRVSNICVFNSCIKPQKIAKHSERISKIRSLMNQYEWKEANFHSEAIDWKIFETSNKAIAFNVSFSPHNSEKK